jgi:hypothetical protein
MGGKIKTERAFKIKIIPKAVAMVTFEALTIGAKADIALPPQMDVPAVIKRERGEGILKNFAKIFPIINKEEILIKVVMIPSKPSLNTT